VDSTNPGSTVTSTADGAVSRAGEAAAGKRADSRVWSTDSRLARSGRNGWQHRLRRAVRWSLVAAGRPTRQARMLPGFLIVGAQRCGTTSLFDVLRQHPAVFGARMKRKELHFFDNEYQRGLAWYQAQFPLRVSARLAARGTGMTPVAFEASPYYMFHPLVPERIERDLPGVKLLVLVRDPVERAYSQHAHQVGLGLESEPFGRALELEDARTRGEAERLARDPSYLSRNHWLYAYRTRGHYADQLEKLEQSFGRDRIHVIDSGDFFTAPGPVYDQVLGFLDLPPCGHPIFTPQNARPRSPMPETLRAELEEYFRPHDKRLAAWLGREPSWRR
jgi:Sulfotransferase domain